MTVFVSALVVVIGLAWTFAVPSGDTVAAPADGAVGGADDDPSDGSAPAGPSLTSETDEGGESTTTYDSYTTLTRSPDTGGDAAPVPLAATSSVPRTTATTSPGGGAPTTFPSCIDTLTGNTARCVTTTAPGPGATLDVCDTSVGRTTDPGCTGGTAFPTTTSIDVDPCAQRTTQGCPVTTTGPAPSLTVPPPTATTAPPVTCFPVACPATTRATP